MPHLGPALCPGAAQLRMPDNQAPLCTPSLPPLPAHHPTPPPNPHPARQREVFNPKAQARLQPGAAPGAPRVAQAGITLHRKHEQPSGGCGPPRCPLRTTPASSPASGLDPA